jgi:hypothetical protein
MTSIHTLEAFKSRFHEACATGDLEHIKFCSMQLLEYIDKRAREEGQDEE